MADSKVSNLTDIGQANISTDDLLYVVDTPGTTPASRKMTIGELLTFGISSGYWYNVVKAASDQDISSNTTVATDAELFFTMAAATLYEWELVVFYSSPVGGGTPDFKYAFTGPATLTGIRTTLSYVTTTDTLTGALGQNALTTTSSVGTATTPRMAWERGWAYSTAGGTGSSGFQFQWSQATSSGNATRRLAGSYLRYRPIA